MADTTILTEALLDAYDWLEAQGRKAPRPRRDPREPGRRQKERDEASLAGIIRRILRKQGERIQQRFEMMEPARKAMPTITDFDDDWLDDDDEWALYEELVRIGKNGITLFGATSPIGIDYTRANTEVAKWARRWSGELYGMLNQTTKDALKEAIASFATTPGMTIGDVIRALPLDYERAERVAITEVTRAYAAANKESGKELQKEFPGVRVIKQWFTNNDDLVCEICAPLDGMIVDIDDGFTTEDDKSEGLDDPPAHINCRCWTTTTTDITGTRGK